MTITKELYLAILSMDAYNQGYGVGINHGKTSIGSATKLSESNTRQDSNEVTAGFYAVAYTMGADAPQGLAGKTVISYRGTDNTSLFSDPIAGGSDILQGGIAGIGDPTSQTDLAIQFYENVMGKKTPSLDIYSLSATNAILTGHSLGGGLAGFVSALTGTRRVRACTHHSSSPTPRPKRCVTSRTLHKLVPKFGRGVAFYGDRGVMMSNLGRIIRPLAENAV